MTTKQWFETNEQYTIEDALGERQWPRSLALVRVNEDNQKTQLGWGRESFARNHARNRFAPRRALAAFLQHRTPFGIVMRSLPMVCVDLDGKNGGIQACRMLRLPPTLAERSKSGNGYHLFYRVPEATWHEKYGYEEFPDFNGLLPGVDIRSTGIIYHWPRQRWNTEGVADLPDTLRRLMTNHKRSREISQARKVSKLDGDDLAVAQEQTLERLAKGIAEGKRNQTLFAIGCDLRLYGVDGWEEALTTRALMLGLPLREAEQIVENVKRYS